MRSVRVNRARVLFQEGARHGFEIMPFAILIFNEVRRHEIFYRHVQVCCKSLDVVRLQERPDNLAAVPAVTTIDFLRHGLVMRMHHVVDFFDRQTTVLQKTTE